MIIKNIQYVDSAEVGFINIKTKYADFDIEKIEITCFMVIGVCVQVKLVLNNDSRCLCFVDYSTWYREWKFKKRVSKKFVLNYILGTEKIYVSYEKQVADRLKNYEILSKQEFLL